MKLTKYLFFLFICLFFSACSDDKNDDGGGGGGKEERPETLAWIEDTMREHYYWYGDIPKADKLNYKSEEEDFFKSLLTKKDGKVIDGIHRPYSYIEDTSENTRSSIQENKSYGFEFTGVYLNETEIGALILYVVPNSPAEDAQLKRGDWITKIDNKPITSNAMFATLYGDVARTLTVERWDPTIKHPQTGEEIGGWVNTRDNVPLAAARTVVDNPVYTYNIIPTGNKTVGYLLYNHFTAGIDKDKSYDDELRRVSSILKGVDEFVLDLRYNNGGLLSSAQLLCAILTPEAKLGQTFGYLKYNDKQKIPNQYFHVTDEYLKPNGKNLDLKRLYVLTSSSSASSSEMVINSLSAFMDVIIIGDKTVGKNVGSISYPNDNNPYPYGKTTWELHPIVCQISNSLGFTEYSDGFKPGLYKGKGLVEEGAYIDEAFDHFTNGGKNYVKLVEILPLGDENERMLKVALSMIDGSYKATRSTISTHGKTFKKLPFNSINRKATNSVTIDINP